MYSAVLPQWTKWGRYGTRMGSLGFFALADAQLTELGADRSRRELFN